MEPYQQIGTFGRPHGLHGELKLLIEPGFEAVLDEVGVVFVGNALHPLPHFVQHIREGNQILIKLEDVNSREEAELFKAKAVYLKASELEMTPAEEEYDSPYQSWEGYVLLDKELGRVGIIEEVRELPFQYVAVLSYAEGEVLIPLHENLILATDDQKKEILMDLPEGLLDLK